MIQTGMSTPTGELIPWTFNRWRYRGTRRQARGRADHFFLDDDHQRRARWRPLECTKSADVKTPRHTSVTYKRLMRQPRVQGFSSRLRSLSHGLTIFESWNTTLLVSSERGAASGDSVWSGAYPIGDDAGFRSVANCSGWTTAVQQYNYGASITAGASTYHAVPCDQAQPLACCK